MLLWVVSKEGRIVKRTRLMLAVVLALALALPMTAGAVLSKKLGDPKLPDGGLRIASEPANDTFAGSEALMPTVVGTLDAQTDRWDTFFITLAAGQKLSVTMTAADPNVDFDMYLYSEAATSTASDDIWSSFLPFYPESFTYVANVPGTYYLGVYAASEAPASSSYTINRYLEAAEADDEIPGVTLPSSPVTGTLDRYRDQDDVYQTHLDAGESIRLSTSGPQTADFDLYLYGPSATSVFTSTPSLESTGDTSIERGVYTAPRSGFYYVDMYSAFGKGPYTLYHETGVLSTMSFSGPTTIKYGATAVLKGSLKDIGGVPRAGQTVTLQAKAYNASTWSTAATASVDASGNFVFRKKPPVTTYYRALFDNDAENLISMTSASVKVKPAASVSVPYLARYVRRGVAFTSYGFLKPRHSAGARNVKLYFQRKESGRYVTRRIVSATNVTYTSTTTKYRARLSLPNRGSWRVRAVYPTTSKCNYTTSGYRSFYVR